MKSIKIGSPYLSDFQDKTRLCAELRLPDKNFTLYFETQSAYRDFLCIEDSDAFLLMLLEYAMLKGLNLEFEGKISQELYYNMTTFYIPVLCNNIKQYKEIVIHARLLQEMKKSASGVATGFSAGVDSFYTVLKYLNFSLTDYQLTHVLFVNVGSQTYDQNRSQNLFQQKAELFEEAVKELSTDVQFVAVNSNCLDLYGELEGKGFTGPDARKTCSCAMALKKLLGKYYFSSGLGLDRFFFSPKDPAQYDLFTINMMSIVNIRFYLTGIEQTKRIDKVKKIADNEVVQKYLSVCSGENCGKCNKCVRTQLELYALGKLEQFKASFHIEDFKKDMVMLAAKNFALKEEREDGFVNEIIEEAQKNHKTISKSVYILSFFMYRPMFYLKNMLKRIIRGN